MRPAVNDQDSLLWRPHKYHVPGRRGDHHVGCKDRGEDELNIARVRIEGAGRSKGRGPGAHTGIEEGGGPEGEGGTVPLGDHYGVAGLGMQPLQSLDAPAGAEGALLSVMNDHPRIGADALWGQARDRNAEILKRWSAKGVRGGERALVVVGDGHIHPVASGG